MRFGVPFFDQLDPETADWLRARELRKSYEANETLFIEQSPSTHLLVVHQGLLRIERVALSGQRQMLTLAGRGDTVGELAMLDGAPRSASCVAMAVADVGFIGRHDVECALESFPDLALTFARNIADRLRALTDQLLEVTSGTALSRTAGRISQLVPDEIVSGGFDLEVRVSQSELAAWAGLSREGTVKALRELRDQGIVETSRRRVRVVDVELLRRVATA